MRTRSSRQERSHVLQRCSATEVQTTEDARQHGAQPPNPPNPPSPPKPEEAEPSREEAEPLREVCLFAVWTAAESAKPSTESHVTYMQRKEDWPLAQKMLEEQKVHDFQVAFVNRGGVRGDLAGIEAFMPFSKMCTGLGGLNAAQYYKKLMLKLPGLNLRVKVVLVCTSPSVSVCSVNGGHCCLSAAVSHLLTWSWQKLVGRLSCVSAG